MDADHFHAIVIGTGFGGAVTACRLVEAGLKVCVLERGRRYGPDDFPRYPTDELFAGDENRRHFAPPPDFSRWLWGRDQGLYDVRDLGDAISVQAAGYGGGSLIYANVHLRPPAEVFDHGWPAGYNSATLEPYFDLAAYMLGVAPIPQQLAKTMQLRRAAVDIAAPGEPAWFRAPLAVNFGQEKPDFGRPQHECDMRGRCWRGCDHLAKNTLDLNYLARVEDGNKKCEAWQPDIRTLAEVKQIVHEPNNEFTVTYDNLAFRDTREGPDRDEGRYSVHAPYVFVCAGSVGTTELLFKNRAQLRMPKPSALGSHYFPNADSFSVVFDCDQPHEADYGPTITSALRYQDESNGTSYTVDFSIREVQPKPTIGTPIVSTRTGCQAILAHPPILDWGSWKKGTAVGTLVLEASAAPDFAQGDTLIIANTTVVARAAVVRHKHWFLVEDGGYPPDLLPLVGIFRSPLWLRRNRYAESSEPRLSASMRRSRPDRLRFQTLTDALGGTARAAAPSRGVLARTFDPRRQDLPATAGGAGKGKVLLPGLLTHEIGSIFPGWFVTALDNDRQQLIEQGAAFALPMLGRLLDELSERLADQLDTETRRKFVKDNVDGAKLEVLVRGMLRQALQILAGSESLVASEAARLLLDPVPGTPGELLNLVGDVLLWILDYGTTDNHTGVLLTMGRDLYRGRLRFKRPAGKRSARTLRAELSPAFLDTGSAAQERVLRDIAGAWHGELRTNPAWTTLQKRVTVHSQGGCPMGDDPRTSVTRSTGEVHDCPGLYVMDAAAFPASVGVNPSATIAAVAEYKVETFIRRHGHEFRPSPSRDAQGAADGPAPQETPWATPDKSKAAQWAARVGRSVIDPINQGSLPPNRPPKHRGLVLTFREALEGFFKELDNKDDRLVPEPAGGCEAEKLLAFHRSLPSFTNAEDAGIVDGGEIRTRLRLRVQDLSRLLAPGDEAPRTRVAVTGDVTLTTAAAGTPATFRIIKALSFVQLFIRAAESPAQKYFRYHLEFDHPAYGRRVFEALKVLIDSPGADLWHDTSTLYFEISGGSGPLQRGILRLSIESFLRVQMPSVRVSGTKDPARKSWALVAFYKYLCSELSGVYLKRADELMATLGKFLTNRHV